MKKLITIFALTFLSMSAVQAIPVPPYTTDFDLASCTFVPTGENQYFNLAPGRRSVFAGEEDGEHVDLIITVLDETQTITLLDKGPVETRVVEERELVNGKLLEVSRNFFATCMGTNDVFYFGEDVDIFEDDGTVVHEGAWRAGVDGAKPGIIMPGRFLIGARYFQEQAEGIALDRAENLADNVTIETEAGTFEKCVRVIERNSLEPGQTGNKVYCPGIGLTADDSLKLTVAP